MGLYSNFPYTNFHEMNLDWIISTMKNLVEAWESFGTTATASAYGSDTATVEVEGDLKTGLVFTFGLPKGDAGAEGVGIVSIVYNPDYTLTINLSDGTHYTTGSIRGEQGATGSGLEILDTYTTLTELETAHPTGNSGDAYLVGSGGAYTLYIWSTSNSQWADAGSLSSPSPSSDTPLMYIIPFLSTLKT